MKIAVLFGSPRKRDSYRVCKLIEKSFVSKNMEFEYIFLKQYKIETCKGCGQCFQKGESFCPCEDELQLVKERLMTADGIIFASPVYACHITGLMKCTLDRLAWLFHRQELIGKPSLVAVTTDGGGQGPAARYLKMTACGWGCHVAGEVKIISPCFFEGQSPGQIEFYRPKYREKELVKIKRAARSLESALLAKTLRVPSYYEIFLFQCLRSKTFVSKADHDYWKEKGWLGSQYFYPVKLSPGKVLFANLVRMGVDRAAAKRLKAVE